MPPKQSSHLPPGRPMRAGRGVCPGAVNARRIVNAPMRRSLRLSSRSVVPNSTSSESSDVLSASATPEKTPNIMVEVPQGRNPSDYHSLSPASSSGADSVFDNVADQAAVEETPATTATNTSPTESDAAGSSRPKARVNASARMAELRNSAFALGNRSTASRKRSAAATVDDEELARSLQAQEYGEAGIDAGPSKKRKLPAKKATADYVVRESDDSEDGSSLTELSVLSSPEPVNRREKKVDIHDSSDEDLSVSDVEEEDEDDSDAELSAVSEDDVDGASLARRVRASRQSSWRRRGAAPVSRFGDDYRTGKAQAERRRLEKNHPEITTMWEDLEKVPAIVPTPDPQPPGINRRLKPFQLEGLNWMRRQEQTVFKGGLLGDEMGMGKTIQAVSLLMSDYPAGRPSLVVVPPVALMQWSSEIQSYTDGKLKVLIYHNSNPKVKHLTAKDLQAYDVIMISYSGLESMHRKEVKGWSRRGGLVKEDSVIHSIHYHRLILDEAHNIKQRTTSVAHACFALKSNYKWCLSGTPVQNRIGEFFSLLRFLEVKPFACYFCKQCSCNQLHWSQDEEKKCTHCKHSGFQHVSVFNQEILNPITDTSASDSKRKMAFKKLQLLTDKIMLRRVKKDHTSSMELPPKRIELHNEFFGEMERDFSRSIMTNSTRQFDTYVSRGVMLNNYANIFGLIMQMRQVANHPDLILKKHAEGGQNVLVCCICDEPAEDAIRSRCRHEFCRQCVKDYIDSFESNNVPDCPRCHIALSIDLEQPEIEQHDDDVKKNSIINRIHMDNWTSSTKIEMLVYDLYKLRSKKQTHKSIVFSQFTSMLQLVEWRLRKAGINTVMLDGSMTPAQRQKSIEYFMNNVDVEVFLVSLKAGGVALNLTEASRVFIVDPWWNPAAEWQSADRCHRIGQRRPCVITRLCIEDSVESRMVLLQEKKAKMIRGTLDRDQAELLEKLTPQDMQFLFRGN